MNDFSELYEYQTRIFGNWCEDNVKSLSKNFIDPRNVDKNYDGSYDTAYINGKKFIKVEIKGSRARKIDSDSYSLIGKIATLDDKYEVDFLQIKPYCTDVFIFVIVWKNVIKYYVVLSAEVKQLKGYSDHQHRGNKHEGQIHFNYNTIKELEPYEVDPSKIDEVMKSFFK
jgi:hypothetical protein